MNKKPLEKHWMREFQKAAQADKQDHEISLWRKEALDAYVKYFFLYFNSPTRKSNSKIKILDIGCGPGTFTKPLAQKGFKLYGIDPVSEVIKIAKQRTKNKNAEYQVGNIYKIPFPDNYFDIIICLGLFQTLDNARAALKEIRKKLKSNGMIIITTLNCFSVFRHFFKKKIKPKSFNPFVFKKTISKHGFKLIKLKGIYFFPKRISFLTEIIIKFRFYKFFNLFFWIFNVLSHSFYVEARNK